MEHTNSCYFQIFLNACTLRKRIIVNKLTWAIIYEHPCGRGRPQVTVHGCVSAMLHCPRLFWNHRFCQGRPQVGAPPTWMIIINRSCLFWPHSALFIKAQTLTFMRYQWNIIWIGEDTELLIVNYHTDSSNISPSLLLSALRATAIATLPRAVTFGRPRPTVYPAPHLMVRMMKPINLTIHVDNEW